MTVNPIFLMEFLLFDGAALAWAGWEIWSVRRGKDDPEPERQSPPSKDAPGHPEG
jgi:hypothetical protein